MWLIIIILLIVSLISVISPRSSWYISNFWRFQDNAKPSDFALRLYRATGVITLFVMLIWIYVKIFN